MIDQSNETAIRARAYQLWEESGGEHGKDEEHWRQAKGKHSGAAEDADLTADELAGISKGSSAMRTASALCRLKIPRSDNPGG